MPMPLGDRAPLMRSLPLPSSPWKETGWGPDCTSKASRSERNRRGPLGKSFEGGGGAGVLPPVEEDVELAPPAEKPDAQAEPRHNSQANRKKVAGRRQDSGVTQPRRQPQLVRPYQAKPTRKMPPVNRASRARTAAASVRKKRRTSRIHTPPTPLTSARKKPGGQGLERRCFMGHPVPVHAEFEFSAGVWYFSGPGLAAVCFHGVGGWRNECVCLK